MDPKAWANIGVNALSFGAKAIIWTYMISQYNNEEEKKVGAVVYADSLWNNNGQLFLWDYMASFLIKMSIFVFIFEMMKIRVILSSETPDIAVRNHKRRRIIMYSVISVHTLCILFIEIYNWLYFIEKNKCIKYGVTGLIYQSIKFIVLIIDLLMVHQLKSFADFYILKARSLTRSQRNKISYFLAFIIYANIIWLVLRCFVRNLAEYLGPYGITVFAYIH
jgi:hypothetical protein